MASILISGCTKLVDSLSKRFSFVTVAYYKLLTPAVWNTNADYTILENHNLLLPHTFLLFLTLPQCPHTVYHLCGSQIVFVVSFFSTLVSLSTLSIPLYSQSLNKTEGKLTQNSAELVSHFGFLKKIVSHRVRALLCLLGVPG